MHGSSKTTAMPPPQQQTNNFAGALSTEDDDEFFLGMDIDSVVAQHKLANAQGGAAQPDHPYTPSNQHGQPHTPATHVKYPAQVQTAGEQEVPYAGGANAKASVLPRPVISAQNPAAVSASPEDMEKQRIIEEKRRQFLQLEQELKELEGKGGDDAHSPFMGTQHGHVPLSAYGRDTALPKTHSLSSSSSEHTRQQNGAPSFAFLMETDDAGHDHPDSESHSPQANGKFPQHTHSSGTNNTYTNNTRNTTGGNNNMDGNFDQYRYNQNQSYSHDQYAAGQGSGYDKPVNNNFAGDRPSTYGSRYSTGGGDAYGAGNNAYSAGNSGYSAGNTGYNAGNSSYSAGNSGYGTGGSGYSAGNFAGNSTYNNAGYNGGNSGYSAGGSAYNSGSYAGGGSFYSGSNADVGFQQPPMVPPVRESVPLHLNLEDNTEGSYMSHKNEANVSMCMVGYAHASIYIYIYIYIYIDKREI